MGHVCMGNLHKEYQIPEQMKFGFVIAPLMIPRDFCQLAQPPPSPGGLEQQRLVGSWDALGSSGSAGNTQRCFLQPGS